MSTLLTCPEVCAKLKVRKTTLYKWLREDETFPRQIQLGPRVVRWKEHEIDAWIDNHV